MVSEAGGDNSTYQRILEILKKTGGGTSVKSLCEELELSSMAVRRQLALLQGRDLIFATKSKKKTGRPEYRYFLTDNGHEAFRREYAEAAIELLVQLRTDDGRDRINQLFKGRKDAWVERARGRISGKTLEVRVHEVTRLLTEEGYMATWEKLGPDSYLIREMNCPVAKIARKFPQTCVYEEDFLAELLGAKVTRKHHILQKDHFCSYVVDGS